MGDSINIDWGNVKQAASPYNAFMQGLATARAMNLAKSEDEARAEALANPSDMSAITRLAVYNQEAAAPLRQQLQGNAAAGVISSYNQPNALAPTMAQPAPNTPQLAPSGLPAVAPGASFKDAFAPLASGQAPAAGGQVQQAPQMPPQALVSPDAPHMQQIGAAASQGQMNPAQALAELAKVGGPEAVTQMVNAVAGMDKVRLTRLADANDALGTAAQTLLSVPQSQRAAMLTQMAPQLAQHGITTDQIQQAIAQGLGDQQLHGFVGQAVGVTGLIEQANKERQYGQTDRQLGQADQRIGIDRGQLSETIRHNKFEEGRGVQDGFGNIVNPTTGNVIYSQGGSGTGNTLATRNNNPGNIRDGAYAKSLPGYVGSEGGFAKFDSVQSGSAAQTRLLQSYIAKGFDTPAEIAARWAPAGDGNNPAAYAKSLAQAAGIGVNDKVTPDKIAAIAQAQARLEGFGGGGAGGLTADAIDTAAQLAIQNGGKMPQGYARNKAAQAAIQNRIAALASEQGISVPELVQRGQETHSAGKVYDSFTSGKDAQTVQALNNTTQHLATLGKLADALNNSNLPAFNSIANAWAKATGNPAPSNFAAAKQIIGGEIVKVIAGAGGGQGDREEAARVIAAAGSPAQLKGAINTIKDLLGSQLHTLQNKYQAGTNRGDFAKFLTPEVKVAWGIGGTPNVTMGRLVQGSGNVLEWHP